MRTNLQSHCGSGQDDSIRFDSFFLSGWPPYISLLGAYLPQLLWACRSSRYTTAQTYNSNWHSLVAFIEDIEARALRMVR